MCEVMMRTRPWHGRHTLWRCYSHMTYILSSNIKLRVSCVRTTLLAQVSEQLLQLNCVLWIFKSLQMCLQSSSAAVQLMLCHYASHGIHSLNYQNFDELLALCPFLFQCWPSLLAWESVGGQVTILLHRFTWIRSLGNSLWRTLCNKAV